jgi:Na+/proline symporter
MPGADGTAIVVASSVYLVLMVLIGLWAARRTRSARDFFIAGQRPGVFVTSLATMSAAFSGFVFLGGPGLTYRIGVASLWIVIPVGFTGGLLCWTVGRRLRLLAGVREVYTIPDAVACRFGSPAATGLAALSVAAGSVAYLAAQVLATGVVLSAVFGIERAGLALGLGLLVLVAYSVLGGMLAGVYTDVLQGSVMLVAAVAVFGRALTASGGWSRMTATLAESSRNGFLEPLGGAPALTAFGFFFVFGVGVLGQPQMLHKFYMLRDPRTLKWLPLVLGVSQALCLLVWIGVGLAVPALVAQGGLEPLYHPDQATPSFLTEYASPLLAGVTFAGILAAIMSTSDSLLNIGAAALVRDLPRAFGRPVADELGLGRVAVVAVAAAAGGLAWVHGDLIALIGTFAFGTFAAALAPTLAVGLTWHRVNSRAAMDSMATGLSLNLALELLARQTRVPGLPGGVLPSAVSLAASFSVLMLVSWWTGRDDPDAVPADVRSVMEA